LAENGNVAGIAAKRADIVPHPFECLHDIQHSRVTGIGETFVRVAEPSVAECTEAVVQRDDNEVARFREIAAVEPGRAAGAPEISAAVQPDHDRPLCIGIEIGCPNIEGKTVLTGGLKVANPGIRRFDDAVVLRATRSEVGRVAHVRPGRYGGGW